MGTEALWLFGCAAQSNTTIATELCCTYMFAGTTLLYNLGGAMVGRVIYIVLMRLESLCWSKVNNISRPSLEWCFIDMEVIVGTLSPWGSSVFNELICQLVIL